MEILVRLGIKADLTAIEKFDEMGGDRDQEMDEKRCFVAINDLEEVVGYASYQREGLVGRPFLDSVCVIESARREGVAKALVKRIEKAAKPEKLLSSAEDWNHEMLQFFQSQGWEAVGTLKGVNEDGSSEIFFAKDLK
ncbi:GNAT family N-acetyltransferase [filamentous cyanobacterium LEGE 11480]|uniref:GNAT family N-acetyltransferase n=1 Tax=Romeriopsis navalis LEGE 11480 TaxID=2777977 RepID=A0A928VLB1_9CYAN|nr:GNAT family N-acetyltransferase [Romeriopsis navalis]MBE9029828.1 GNAT family N-acetyltransferase [Romeriopsis navalis LEGE 11480]